MTSPDLSPLALQVWRRNFEVWLVTWRTAFVGLAEPIFTFLAFGVGLGAVTKEVPWDGRVVEYAAFVAPGVVAMGVMFQAFFECLYGAYIRMYYQRTFDAITATPASMDDVVLGEALWGMTRGALGALTTLLVVLAFGHAHTPWVLLAVPLAAAGGFFFGCFGLCFTGIVKDIESINYPLHLLGVPMYLFGGLFFPLDAMPTWIRAVSYLNPMFHLCDALRRLFLVGPDLRVALVFAGLLVASVPLLLLAMRLMRRRLVR
jgi:lipooligosaccharide transport system permease protein